MIVGILGGVGAGKSTVVRMMRELGARTVDADRLAHEELESPGVRRELRKWLGPDVFDQAGRVDRRAVGRTVFGDREKLERLERLVHPRVRQRILEEVEAFRREQVASASGSSDEGSSDESRAEGLLVLDVPLLPSTPLRDACDALVFVDADVEVRRQRVERARGWSARELETRESHQMPVEEKRRLADFVIDNSRTEEETRRQVEACLQELRQRAGAGAPSDERRRHETGGNAHEGQRSEGRHTREGHGTWIDHQNE